MGLGWSRAWPEERMSCLRITDRRMGERVVVGGNKRWGDKRWKEENAPGSSD